MRERQAGSTCHLSPKGTAQRHGAEEYRDEKSKTPPAHPIRQRHLSGYVQIRQDRNPGRAGEGAPEEGDGRTAGESE